ncbi:MAG: CO dehydrogenase/acetyl-CoA synthase complex subunit alpha [Methanocellales archaeon]|nr:CO dehydrogenase/acetyl-CoA synthase complex subunit alpha [Methanocellales archaeon]
MKGTKFKIDEFESDLIKATGLEITVGRIVEEEWEEILGPTPMPSVTDLRKWDFALLNRYKPMYAPLCDLCCLCTYGKCDLSDGKKGACGIDIGAQQGRIVLLACCIGAAAHGGHARHIVEHLIEEHGDMPIDMGKNVEVEAPLVRLIAGIMPKKLSDLLEPLEYAEGELMHSLSATHTGQEGYFTDFESKALHVSMTDQLLMEIADVAQISALGFPKGDPGAPLVDIGFGSIDTKKPVILCIGHNVVPGAEVINYLRDHDLYDKVEVAGICCTAHDLTRYDKGAKIVGPLSKQLQFVRTGIADVIIVDEQCVRADVLQEARKTGAAVIATNDKICLGLPDRTKDSPKDVIDNLLGGAPGALILDAEKVGEVAVRTAIKLSETRKRRALNVVKEAKKCIQCGLCIRECHNNLDIPRGMEKAAKGDLSLLSEIYELCIGCGRCENVCSKEIPIVSLLGGAAKEITRKERYKVRSGRGPIQDTEIRNVGSPIVLGEIPGVVAFVGCPNYAGSSKEIAEMAEIFLSRRYIVTTSGCAAMDIAMYKDEEGKTLYEKYPGNFDAGCLSNVGSCVSNAHIAGAAIKIASIFAHRNLRGNYEEIADYILNRVGAVGVAWGAMSQKAASIATGFNRLGVPVILGPRGAKYRRTYLGRPDKSEDWMVYNARTGEKVQISPSPEYLLYVAESKEEAIVSIAKNCIRPNDTTKGRQIKLTHYIDLHKRYFGKMPEDIAMYIRTEADIPITLKAEIMKILKAEKWEPRITPDPTLLERLCRKKEVK